MQRNDDLNLLYFDIILYHLQTEVVYVKQKFKYCEIVHQHKHVIIQNKRIGIVPYWLLNQCLKMVLNA